MKNPSSTVNETKLQCDFSNEDRIIVMGGSSGGPEALIKIIRSLPGD